MDENSCTWGDDDMPNKCPPGTDTLYQASSASDPTQPALRWGQGPADSQRTVLWERDPCAPSVDYRAPLFTSVQTSVATAALGEGQGPGWRVGRVFVFVSLLINISCLAVAIQLIYRARRKLILTLFCQFSCCFHGGENSPSSLMVLDKVLSF